MSLRPTFDLSVLALTLVIVFGFSSFAEAQQPLTGSAVDAFVGKWYSTTFERGVLDISQHKGGILTARGTRLYGGLHGDYSDAHVTGDQLLFTNGVYTFLGHIDKGKLRIVYGPSDLESDFVRDEKLAKAMSNEDSREGETEAAARKAQVIATLKEDERRRKAAEDPAVAAERRAQTLAAIAGVATQTMQTLADGQARNAEIRQQAEQQRAAQNAQQQEALNERLAAQRAQQLAAAPAQQQQQQQRAAQIAAAQRTADERKQAELQALTKSRWSPAEASFDPRSPQPQTFSLIAPNGGLVLTMSVAIVGVTINGNGLAQGVLAVDVLNASRCTLLLEGFLNSKGAPIKDLGDKDIGPGQRISENGPSGRFYADGNSRLVFKPGGFLHDCQ